MGIGIAEMLMRCNILALVGGGVLPKFPKNRIVIWDDFQNRVCFIVILQKMDDDTHRSFLLSFFLPLQAIAELEFSSEVKAVKIRKEVFVSTLSQTHEHIAVFNDQLAQQCCSCS